MNNHPKFEEYKNFIVNNEAYKGLPYVRKKDGSIVWVATKQSKIGKKRIEWALNKAEKFGISKNDNSFYRKVMFMVHPTKEKVCQICGESMSLDYIYPNKSFQKFLSKNYDYEPNVFDDIYDVSNHFKEEGKSDLEIIKILNKSIKLEGNFNDLTIYIKSVIEACRNGEKKSLGPGAMSNFPDRYDGFHSYNRCCRQEFDKGRNPDNMKTYSKDRRAYENWSDGNIHAANKFMKSKYFIGLSADHIGPISLGFIHDPRFMQPMSSGDNSSKRDRLEQSDIKKLIELESRYNLLPVSWFSEKIWKALKADFLIDNDINLEYYINLMKININNYMSLLYIIITETGELGKKFLEENFLKPKQEYFKYDYKFDEFGNIINKTFRNISDATKKEYSRFIRISFESVIDFAEKENRNIKSSFNTDITKNIDSLVYEINNCAPNKSIVNHFYEIVSDMQDNLLKEA